MPETQRPPSPEYLLNRPDAESLDFGGRNTSFEIFSSFSPTLNWEYLKQVAKETNLPIGDLGSSFSTLPTEGELHGVNIIPIDVKHQDDRYMYAPTILKKMSKPEVANYYKNKMLVGRGFIDRIKFFAKSQYKNTVSEAIHAVMHKYVVADLAQIPLRDRSLAISIAHMSLPKHSLSVDTFLKDQLPEMLRVTDRTVYMWPLAIYKPFRFNDTTGLTRKVSFPEHSEIIEKIQTIANLHGFDFQMKTNGNQVDPMFGVFTRK